MSFNNNGSELLYANGGQRELRLQRSGHQLIVEIVLTVLIVLERNANFPLMWLGIARQRLLLSDRRYQIKKLI